MTNKTLRTIRSFVRRQGRLTQAQTSALNDYWSDFGIDYQEKNIDFALHFPNQNPITLEIGFGNGEALFTMAQQNPHKNFLGIEVHTPGVGQLIHQLQLAKLTNVRILRHDAVEVLQRNIADHSLAGINIFFPDPWHKKRHHKRRLIQTHFIDLLALKMQAGGQLHLATDWEDYAWQMLTVLSNHHQFSNQVGEQQFATRPSWRPLTKFERRGQRLGHQVWDLLFTRKE